MKLPEVNMNCFMNSEPQRILDFGVSKLNPGLCREKCKITPDCNYFEYLLNTRKCQLFSSPKKLCQDIMGQPQRTLRHCYEGPDDPLSMPIIYFEFAIYNFKLIHTEILVMDWVLRFNIGFLFG